MARIRIYHGTASASARARATIVVASPCRGYPMSDATPPTGPSAPSKEQLKAAFKAFKKRLKLTRLEEESKLSRRPVTSGKGSDIVGIMPPGEFPQAVWDELVRQGRLKCSSQGMYELVPE